MKIKQGDIFWADLNPVRGSEQAGFRPVLVVQGDVLTRALPTVLIAPITTNLKAKGKLTTFFLSSKEHGIPKDSIALLFQLRTIDKSRLTKKIMALSSKDMEEVKQQISYVFS